ncbi:hypothetical protein RFEPED_1570 [Rickettsia felis str. Pedreira]|uniref:Transcriptional regulator n=3 Tax=Rickettsia felis TaxID=42862 RepID=A0A0F3MX98_RICFI|nr:DUF4160 domain-containing protein [Rickettsia felis]AAY61740.1 unknown [Rickettsia felis URRWXCal2]KHO02725.1 transcriptional regulator [Rickettsia felis str. LSU]KHO03498.1 transcriptional regulator [Rickettsia felis]KJV59169.1 hypothetical protein RFEPED_1570 [Rickettsia felis str. Pedreira]MDE8611341.1 DUF4160 domain-containing protein [Rickettsia felis]
MPVISRFFGIIIMMYYRDHNPPHFHARYGDYEVIISLNGKILEGKFLKRALQLVTEWLNIHKEELIDNWNKTQNGEPLNSIAPLE